MTTETKTDRDALEAALDAANLRLVEAIEEDKQVFAKFEEDLAADVADPIAFADAQRAAPLRLASLKLEAARCELAVVDADLADGTSERLDAKEVLSKAEVTHREAEKSLQTARAVYGRISSRVSLLQDRKRSLEADIQRRRSDILIVAQGGRLSTLRPRP